MSASNIRKANMNFIRRLTDTPLGAIQPMTKRASVAVINLTMEDSTKSKISNADNAPEPDEMINLFVDVGTFERQAAKYKEIISTVKFIRKYTST